VVVVLQSNLFAKPDEHGSFHLEAVPEGRYTLRVLYRGAFVHQETIEVGKSTAEVTVKLVAPTGKRSAEQP
jgi:hypothetical protein